MTPVEIKRMKIEYHKVFAARLDLELRLEEQQESIKKLEKLIEDQIRREQEITEKLKQENQ